MILYVSWGGSGRAASVRAAMVQAMSEVDSSNRGLRYLAVLDDDHFSDLDDKMLALVADELRWLLDTQLELTRHQLGAEGLTVDVVVRQGDVIEAVVDVLGERGPADVLVGAPVALSSHGSVEGLRQALSERIGAEVSMVEPIPADPT